MVHSDLLGRTQQFPLPFGAIVYSKRSKAQLRITTSKPVHGIAPALPTRQTFENRQIMSLVCSNPLFKGNPGSCSITILRTDVEFVDGMNLPKGKTFRIARSRLPV